MDTSVLEGIDSMLCNLEYQHVVTSHKGKVTNVKIGGFRFYDQLSLSSLQNDMYGLYINAITMY